MYQRNPLLSAMGIPSEADTPPGMVPIEPLAGNMVPVEPLAGNTVPADNMAQADNTHPLVRALRNFNQIRPIGSY